MSYSPESLARLDGNGKIASGRLGTTSSTVRSPYHSYSSAEAPKSITKALKKVKSMHMDSVNLSLSMSSVQRPLQKSLNWKAPADPASAILYTFGRRELYMKRLQHAVRQYGEVCKQYKSSVMSVDREYFGKKAFVECRKEIVTSLRHLQDVTIECVERTAYWWEQLIIRRDQLERQRNIAAGFPLPSKDISNKLQRRSSLTAITSLVDQQEMEKERMRNEEVGKMTDSKDTSGGLGFALVNFPWRGRNAILEMLFDTVEVLGSAQVPIHSWLKVDPCGNPLLAPFGLFSPEYLFPDVFVFRLFCLSHDIQPPATESRDPQAVLNEMFSITNITDFETELDESLRQAYTEGDSLDKDADNSHKSSSSSSSPSTSYDSDSSFSDSIISRSSSADSALRSDRTSPSNQRHAKHPSVGWNGISRTPSGSKLESKRNNIRNDSPSKSRRSEEEIKKFAGANALPRSRSMKFASGNRNGGDGDLPSPTSHLGSPSVSSPGYVSRTRRTVEDEKVVTVPQAVLTASLSSLLATLRPFSFARLASQPPQPHTAQQRDLLSGLSFYRDEANRRRMYYLLGLHPPSSSGRAEALRERQRLESEGLWQRYGESDGELERRMREAKEKVKSGFSGVLGVTTEPPLDVDLPDMEDVVVDSFRWWNEGDRAQRAWNAHQMLMHMASECLTVLADPNRKKPNSNPNSGDNAPKSLQTSKSTHDLRQLLLCGEIPEHYGPQISKMGAQVTSVNSKVLAGRARQQAKQEARQHEQQRQQAELQRRLAAAMSPRLVMRVTGGYTDVPLSKSEKPRQSIENKDGKGDTRGHHKHQHRHSHHHAHEEGERNIVRSPSSDGGDFTEISLKSFKYRLHLIDRLTPADPAEIEFSPMSTPVNALSGCNTSPDTSVMDSDSGRDSRYRTGSTAGLDESVPTHGSNSSGSGIGGSDASYASGGFTSSLSKRPVSISMSPLKPSSESAPITPSRASHASSLVNSSHTMTPRLQLPGQYGVSNSPSFSALSPTPSVLSTGSHLQGLLGQAAGMGTVSHIPASVLSLALTLAPPPDLHQAALLRKRNHALGLGGGGSREHHELGRESQDAARAMAHSRAWEQAIKAAADARTSTPGSRQRQRKQDVRDTQDVNGVDLTEVIDLTNVSANRETAPTRKKSLYRLFSNDASSSKAELPALGGIGIERYQPSVHSSEVDLDDLPPITFLPNGDIEMNAAAVAALAALGVRVREDSESSEFLRLFTFEGEEILIPRPGQSMRRNPSGALGGTLSSTGGSVASFISAHDVGQTQRGATSSIRQISFVDKGEISRTDQDGSFTSSTNPNSSASPSVPAKKRNPLYQGHPHMDDDDNDFGADAVFRVDSLTDLATGVIPEPSERGGNTRGGTSLPLVPPLAFANELSPPQPITPGNISSIAAGPSKRQDAPRVALEVLASPLPPELFDVPVINKKSIGCGSVDSQSKNPEELTMSSSKPFASLPALGFTEVPSSPIVPSSSSGHTLDREQSQRKEGSVALTDDDFKIISSVTTNHQNQPIGAALASPHTGVSTSASSPCSKKKMEKTLSVRFPETIAELLVSPPTEGAQMTSTAQNLFNKQPKASSSDLSQRSSFSSRASAALRRSPSKSALKHHTSIHDISEDGVVSLNSNESAASQVTVLGSEPIVQLETVPESFSPPSSTSNTPHASEQPKDSVASSVSSERLYALREEVKLHVSKAMALVGADSFHKDLAALGYSMAVSIAATAYPSDSSVDPSSLDILEEKIEEVVSARASSSQVRSSPSRFDSDDVSSTGRDSSLDVPDGPGVVSHHLKESFRAALLVTQALVGILSPEAWRPVALLSALFLSPLSDSSALVSDFEIIRRSRESMLQALRADTADPKSHSLDSRSAMDSAVSSVIHEILRSQSVHPTTAAELLITSNGIAISSRINALLGEVALEDTASPLLLLPPLVRSCLKSMLLDVSIFQARNADPSMHSKSLKTVVLLCEVLTHILAASDASVSILALSWQFMADGSDADLNATSFVAAKDLIMNQVTAAQAAGLSAPLLSPLQSVPRSTFLPNLVHSGVGGPSDLLRYTFSDKDLSSLVNNSLEPIHEHAHFSPFTSSSSVSASALSVVVLFSDVDSRSHKAIVSGLSTTFQGHIVLLDPLLSVVKPVPESGNSDSLYYESLKVLASQALEALSCGILPVLLLPPPITKKSRLSVRKMLRILRVCHKPNGILPIVLLGSHGVFGMLDAAKACSGSLATGSITTSANSEGMAKLDNPHLGLHERSASFGEGLEMRAVPLLEQQFSTGSDDAPSLDPITNMLTLSTVEFEAPHGNIYDVSTSLQRALAPSRLLVPQSLHYAAGKEVISRCEEAFRDLAVSFDQSHSFAANLLLLLNQEQFGFQGSIETSLNLLRSVVESFVISLEFQNVKFESSLFDFLGPLNVSRLSHSFQYTPLDTIICLLCQRISVTATTLLSPSFRINTDKSALIALFGNGYDETKLKDDFKMFFDSLLSKESHLSSLIEALFGIDIAAFPSSLDSFISFILSLVINMISSPKQSFLSIMSRPALGEIINMTLRDRSLQQSLSPILLSNSSFFESDNPVSAAIISMLFNFLLLISLVASSDACTMVTAVSRPSTVIGEVRDLSYLLPVASSLDVVVGIRFGEAHSVESLLISSSSPFTKPSVSSANDAVGISVSSSSGSSSFSDIRDMFPVDADNLGEFDLERHSSLHSISSGIINLTDTFVEKDVSTVVPGTISYGTIESDSDSDSEPRESAPDNSGSSLLTRGSVSYKNSGGPTVILSSDPLDSVEKSILSVLRPCLSPLRPFDMKVNRPSVDETKKIDLINFLHSKGITLSPELSEDVKNLEASLSYEKHNAFSSILCSTALAAGSTHVFVVDAKSGRLSHLSTSLGTIPYPLLSQLLGPSTRKSHPLVLYMISICFNDGDNVLLHTIKSQINSGDLPLSLNLDLDYSIPDCLQRHLFALDGTRLTVE